MGVFRCAADKVPRVFCWTVIHCAIENCSVVDVLLFGLLFEGLQQYPQLCPDNHFLCIDSRPGQLLESYNS